MRSFRSSQALVIIQHENHFSLYLSDETGTYYSLSLEDIVAQVGSGVDLEIVSYRVTVVWEIFNSKNISWVLATHKN